MNAPEMHSAVVQRAPVACAWCPTIFTPKRASWAKFCSTKCRNAYNRASRPEAVKEARELVSQTLGGLQGPDWQQRARKLLGIK